MKEALFLIIPAVAILILAFPIVVEVRVSFNPMFNRAVVALFVFNIKVFYYLVSFHGQFLELENEKETKRTKIEFKSQKFVVMKEFGSQIKDKVKLKKFLVFYNIGTGDAFSSALVCGVLNQILTQLFLLMKSHKPTASFCVYDTISFNKEICEIAARARLSISFFDVVYSFAISVMLTRREMRQDKKMGA